MSGRDLVDFLLGTLFGNREGGFCMSGGCSFDGQEGWLSPMVLAADIGRCPLSLRVSKRASIV